MTSRPTATPETAAPAAAAASEGTGKTARLIAILRDACPEQQALLDAFAPVLCLQEKGSLCPVYRDRSLRHLSDVLHKFPLP